MDEQKENNIKTKFQGLSDKLNDIKETPSVLEAQFDIPAGSTPKFEDRVEEHRPVSTELIDPSTGEIVARETEPSQEDLAKEERIEDLQIAGKLDAVYDNAITAFNEHAGLAENADPRFAARNGEVAAQFLKIALDSANSKVDAKYKRAKIKVATQGAGTPNSVQNNLIVADRNNLLKQLFKGDFERTIEQEVKGD